MATKIKRDKNKNCEKEPDETRTYVLSRQEDKDLVSIYLAK